MVESPSDILRKAREAKGFEGPTEAARAYGWNVPTYISHENGTRGIRVDMAKRYAKAFGINAADLLRIAPSGVQKQTPVGDEVRLTNEVAVGVWRDSTIDNTQGRTKSVVLPTLGTQGAMRFAVEVSDESINRAFVPGEFAIIERIDPSEVMHFAVDKLVYVERSRGPLIERSIRRVLSNDGNTLKLGSHSTSAKYREVITFPSSDRDETIRIEGKVVGKYTEF